MKNSFFFNMALAVLFEALQDSYFLQRYEKAFRKLHTYIGIALQIPASDDGPMVQPKLEGV